MKLGWKKKCLSCKTKTGMEVKAQEFMGFFAAATFLS